MLWYLAKNNSVEFISYYLKHYKKYSDDNKSIYGAYGPPLFNLRGTGLNQISNVVALQQLPCMSLRQQRCCSFDVEGVAQRQILRRFYEDKIAGRATTKIRRGANSPAGCVASGAIPRVVLSKHFPIVDLCRSQRELRVRSRLAHASAGNATTWSIARRMPICSPIAWL